MRVSVVTPAFDAEAWIRDAVASVLAQTHSDWELIVVDDGSHDGSVAAVQEFVDPRIRVLERPHRGVLAQVRNDGIAAATGEAVALLDADDAWLPEKLQRQVALLESRPEVGLVHTGASVLDGEKRLPFPTAPAGPVLPALVEDNFIVNSSVMIRRRVLDERGGFDPDPRFHGSPDYELWLRLAPFVEFAYLREPLTLYRRHARQMTADLRSISSGSLAAFDVASSRDPASFVGLESRLARKTGVLAALAGDAPRARRDLLRALRANPWDLRAWMWLARTYRLT